MKLTIKLNREPKGSTIKGRVFFKKGKLYIKSDDKIIDLPRFGYSVKILYSLPTNDKYPVGTKRVLNKTIILNSIVGKYWSKWKVGKISKINTAKL